MNNSGRVTTLNLPSPILLNRGSIFPNDSSASSSGSNRRNYMLLTDRKDGLIDWMKEMLFHSFVLNEKDTYCGTMIYFEELIEEHRSNDEANYSTQRDISRLKQYVPTVGRFFTSLPLHKAFKIYDDKYLISGRNFVAPSFNEIRHILNLAQIMVIILFEYFSTNYLVNEFIRQLGETYSSYRSMVIKLYTAMGEISRIMMNLLRQLLRFSKTM